MLARALARFSGSVVAPLRERLVDLLAFRAHRVTLRITARHPDLAAQRHHGRAAHGAVDDLVLLDIMGEPLMVAIAGLQIRSGASVFADAALGQDFGTHKSRVYAAATKPPGSARTGSGTCRRPGQPDPAGRSVESGIIRIGGQ